MDSVRLFERRDRIMTMWPSSRWWAVACVGLLCAGGVGCVERRFVIDSNPHGAIVFNEKGRPLSATPADYPFTYYGKYRFTFVKDGYETQVVVKDIKPPWYQLPLIDFVAENLVPWRIQDIRHIEVGMVPKQPLSPDALLQQAIPYRERGRAIGPVAPEEGTPLPAPGVMPPAVMPPAAVAPTVVPPGVVPLSPTPNPVPPAAVPPTVVPPPVVPPVDMPPSTPNPVPPNLVPPPPVPPIGP